MTVTVKTVRDDKHKKSFASLNTMKTAALFLFLAGVLNRSRGWENSFDEPLNFNCPAGQSISSITSENSNYHEDRRWEFTCQATFGQSGECSWTNYVNDFDQPLLFECPAGHVMAGMNSYHNNYYEDRRWRFYCCRSPCVTTNCDWTSYVNSFDEYFTWAVPSRNVLVGAQSYHQNYEEDRRWRYRACVQYRC